MLVTLGWCIHGDRVVGDLGKVLTSVAFGMVALLNSSLRLNCCGHFTVVTEMNDVSQIFIHEF